MSQLWCQALFLYAVHTETRPGTQWLGERLEALWLNDITFSAFALPFIIENMTPLNYLLNLVLCVSVYAKADAPKVSREPASQKVQIDKGRFEDAFESGLPCESCPPINTLGLGVEEMAIISDMASKPKEFWDTGKMKTPEEVDAWLACYPTQWQSNYENYYKHTIKLVGQNFKAIYHPNIEPPVQAYDSENSRKFFSQDRGPTPFIIGANSEVLKCMLRRESLWNPMQKSRTGALGLGQQTSVNVKEMSCLLKGCDIPLATPYKDKNGNLVKFHHLPPEPWAQQAWESTRKKIIASSTPEQVAHLTTHPKTGKKCSTGMSDKEADAPCPLNSILATALNLTYMEYQIREASALYLNSETQDYTWEERFNLILAKAGSHNAGSGSAKNGVRGISPVRWIQNIIAQGRQKEVGGYFQSLQNCLEKDNWGPMNGDKPKTCTSSNSTTIPLPRPRPPRP